MNTIGEKIKALRKQKNMTQQELVGNRITRNQLSLIERGNANPSMATLEYIAERLGITTSSLLSNQPHSINEIQLFIMECEYNNEEGKYDINIDAIINFLDSYNDEIDISIQNYIGKLHVLLGVAYYETKNPKSEFILQKALLLLNKAISPDYIAIALDTFAKHEYHKENYAEMKKYSLEANEVLKEVTLDTIILKLDILYNIALACVRLKQFTEAFDYIDLSLKKSKKHEVYRYYGKLQMLSSLAYKGYKKYEKAIEYNNKAIQYFSLFIDDARRNYCIINNGIIYRLMGDYPKSIENFNTAYHFFEKQNDKEEMLNIRSEQLRTKFFMKINPKDIFEEVQEILEKDSLFKFDRFDLLIISGLILLENCDYEAAKANLTKAEKYYNEFADTEFSTYLLVGLGKIYKQEGNFEKAYFYMEKAQ